MPKKISIVLLLLLLILVLIFVFKETPVNSVPYTPPAAPDLAGILAPNNLLKNSEIIAAGRINGPEDVAVDENGRLYGGTHDGEIIRIWPDGKIETFAVTDGRPLGLHFDGEGNLIVCDAYKGLLAIDREGNVTILAQSADGVPFKFTDDLDIASDGTIYFSDASDTFDHAHYLFDLVESRPHGRLMSYDPADGTVQVLLSNLYFANGVALSENEDFVLVNETYRYRIIRYWLRGPKAGTRDIFADNLPGFPDGISANRKGTFWLALFTVRNPIMDTIYPYPFLKTLLAKLPASLWPKPKPYGFVLAFDEEGNIIKNLQEPTGKYLREITSVQEHEGYLYLGSLHNDRIGRYRLPKAK
ncbi:MAG: SMP-30/gluconolactonase/LRE family protein [Deltaproteobacteria bacterium]|nr:SMP-30/gluconolactonase/LRE family protein [Deltaproteobacteria bacterium]MBN2845964.1 SMP-30/gluconolactonase/LRE family protein [Deltaproteobacteria bacterium]